MTRTVIAIPATPGEHELVEPLKGKVLRVLADESGQGQIALVVGQSNGVTVHRRWFIVRVDPCTVQQNERYLDCVIVKGNVRHVLELTSKTVAPGDLAGDE